MITRIIEEKELTEFGEFAKSKTVVTEFCSSCKAKQKKIDKLEKKLVEKESIINQFNFWRKEDAKKIDELETSNARLFSDNGELVSSFKNFHRLICEVSNYHHDEVDWQRDQASVVEHLRRVIKEKEGEE